MNVCGVTRLLVPASLVGLAVATVAGRDVYGLIAALFVAGILYVIGRVRGASRVCAIPGAATEGRPTDLDLVVDVSAARPRKGPE